MKAEAARTLQGALRHKGYQGVITDRKVSDDLILYRVEIGGLKSLEAADQACHIAIARCWISFAEDAPRGGTNE
jgi:cell division septation protein DedD